MERSDDGANFAGWAVFGAAVLFFVLWTIRITTENDREAAEAKQIEDVQLQLKHDPVTGAKR